MIYDKNDISPVELLTQFIELEAEFTDFTPDKLTGEGPKDWVDEWIVVFRSVDNLVAALYAIRRMSVDRATIAVCDMYLRPLLGRGRAQ